MWTALLAGCATTHTVDRPKLSPEDIKKLETAEATALDGKPLNRVQPGPH